MSLRVLPLIAALTVAPVFCAGASEGTESNISVAESRKAPSLDNLTIQALEERMAQGDLRAQAELGARYGRGAGVQTDVAKAITLLKDAAEKNNPEAQHWLATAYTNGVGVEKNEMKAAQLYEKAAQQGHPEALYVMGVLISTGQAGFAQSWPAAIPYFWKSADQGFQPAEIKLGYIYQEGRGVDVNPQIAAYWYRRTLSRGKAPAAQYNLAILIGRGLVKWQASDPIIPPTTAGGGSGSAVTVQSSP